MDETILGFNFFPYSFPGEGRGPVVGVMYLKAARVKGRFRNWATAFAGEEQKRK